MSQNPKPEKSKLRVGDFTDAGVNLVQSLLDPDASSANRGSGIGGAIGAGLGALAGPAGAQIGSAIGSLAGGLIGGKSDKARARESMRDVMNKKYGSLDIAYNANPYGDGGTFYAEDGLVLPDINEPIKVNIEKGELQVDPATMEVMSKFSSKRYKSHAMKKADEHFGNFITMDSSHVIIPKKKAKAFESGDRITRRSIIAQILMDQDANGVQTNQETPYAKKGLVPTNILGPGDPPLGDGVMDYSNPLFGFKNNGKGNTNIGLPSDTIVTQPVKSVTPQLNNEPNADNSILTNGGLNYMDPRYSYRDVEYTGTDNKKTFKNKLAKFWADLQNGIDNGVDGLGKTLSNIKPMNSVKAAQAQLALPTIYGIGAALQNDPFLKYDENTQFDAAKSYAHQMPIDENLEQVKAQAARNQAAYVKQMGNFNTPSSRAEIANMIGTSNAQTQAVLADAANRRVQRIASKLGMLGDLEQKQGADRLQSRARFALESAQNRAARQNLVQAGLSEYATNKGKYVMDLERIKAINSRLKYNSVTPGEDNVVNENLEAIQNALYELGGFAGVPSLSGNAKGKKEVEKATYDANGKLKGSQVTTTKVGR